MRLQKHAPKNAAETTVMLRVAVQKIIIPIDRSKRLHSHRKTNPFPPNISLPLMQSLTHNSSSLYRQFFVAAVGPRHVPQFCTLPALSPLPACKMESMMARRRPVFSVAVRWCVGVIAEPWEKSALLYWFDFVVQTDLFKALLGRRIWSANATLVQGWSRYSCSTRIKALARPTVYVWDWRTCRDVLIPLFSHIHSTWRC